MNVSYILLSFASLFILGLIDNSRGPIYPELLTQFQVTKSVGSLIFSLSSLTAFIVALFSKFWLQRIGAIAATKWALLIQMLASLLMGIAGHMENGFGLFVAASILFGIGVGFLSLSLNIIIAGKIPLLHRQKVFAGLHSMYGMASLIAPSLLGLVFHFHFPWQNYFILISLLPLIIYLFSLKIPAEILVKNEDKKITTVNKTLKLQLAFLFSFYVATEVLVSSRLVVFLKETWNYPLDKASSFLSLFFLLLLAGRLLFTVLKVKFSLNTLLRISVVITLLFYGLGLFVHPIFLAITGGSMSFFFPCGMTWVSHKYEEMSDSIIAMIMTFVGGAIVIMHALAGVISEVYSINIALYMGGFMLLMVLYLLQKTK